MLKKEVELRKNAFLYCRAEMIRLAKYLFKDSPHIEELDAMEGVEWKFDVMEGIERELDAMERIEGNDKRPIDQILIKAINKVKDQPWIRPTWEKGDRKIPKRQHSEMAEQSSSKRHKVD